MSTFSYNISRPYPFRWFTPTAVVGGIIGLVLFSMINLASNGYDLSTEHRNDPNTTMSKLPWYVSWSWDQQLKPSCESQDISIGSQFFTSNLGFTYTLTSVLQRAPGQNPPIKSGSLSYLNQTLNDCRVDSVHLDLKKVDQTPSGTGFWWSWDDSSATAAVSCTISGPDGLVDISFTTDYKTTAMNYDYVITSNHTDHASMWWGTRLLNAYWFSTLLALGEEPYRSPLPNTDTTPIWIRGGMTFRPKQDADDIKKYESFQPPNFFFVASNGTFVSNITTKITDSTDLSLIYNNPGRFPFSNPLTQGLSWAKIMCSALLVDLGQTASSSSSPFPNLLTDPDLLQYILKHPDDTYRNNPSGASNATRSCDTATSTSSVPCYNYFPDINMFAPPDVGFFTDFAAASEARKTSMIDSYDAFHDKMGQLGTKNATIFAQYACEVPKLKPIGTVILTVLVADLVFLQVCWVLLKWLATTLLERPPHYPRSMYCIGCNGTGGKVDDTGSMDGFGDRMELI